MVKNVESKKCEMGHKVECTVSKYLKLLFFEEKKNYGFYKKSTSHIGPECPRRRFPSHRTRSEMRI